MIIPCKLRLISFKIVQIFWKRKNLGRFFFISETDSSFHYVLSVLWNPLHRWLFCKSILTLQLYWWAYPTVCVFSALAFCSAVPSLAWRNRLEQSKTSNHPSWMEGHCLRTHLKIKIWMYYQGSQKEDALFTPKTRGLCG